jgi:hypothetical protein
MAPSGMLASGMLASGMLASGESLFEDEQPAAINAATIDARFSHEAPLTTPTLASASSWRCGDFRQRARFRA